jgi:hypothetical protein
LPFWSKPSSEFAETWKYKAIKTGESNSIIKNLNVKISIDDDMSCIRIQKPKPKPKQCHLFLFAPIFPNKKSVACSKKLMLLKKTYAGMQHASLCVYLYHKLHLTICFPVFPNYVTQLPSPYLKV